MQATPSDSSALLVIERLAPLRERLIALREAALAVEQTAEDEIALVHPDRQICARNLAHYLALREQDIRELQHELHRVGLTSLGVVQGHVMASINAAIQILDRLCGTSSDIENSPLHPTLASSRRHLGEIADDTLGQPAEKGLVRIMVTMPSEAGDDPSLVEDLLTQGMTIMRVNCAHDGPDTWRRMVEHLDAARRKTGRSCRVAFDLAGPKLRTGPVAESPEAMRFRPIRLKPGDSLVITRDLRPGRPAVIDDDSGQVIESASIGCSLPEVFDHVAVGHRVLLDDGKFEGVVCDVAPDRFRVEINRAGRGEAKLKAEKGINLPDTVLGLPALTAKDIEDLEFVARHADLVSLSFVHRIEDIEHLYQHLDRLGAADLGVILKIENRRAFEHLPELLMTAARRKRLAVMVARGDLGVEIGFERLAEVQEEMLWLCEAARVPVIWATQVLESLAKNGLPSRGEVTDAAMSIRAECVMLNKGPYIGYAIRFLTDVSRRMTQHSQKAFATYRALKVAAKGTAWLKVDHSGHTAR